MCTETLFRIFVKKMAPKRKGTNRPRPTPYNPELLENWTIARLKAACRDRGITFANNIRRLALVRLLNNQGDNHNDRSFSNEDGAIDTDESRSRPRHQTEEGSARSHDATQNQDGGPHGSDNMTEVLTSLTHSVAVLASKVDNLEKKFQESNASCSVERTSNNFNVSTRPDSNQNSGNIQEFSLESAYSHFNGGNIGIHAISSSAAGSPSQLPLQTTTATRTTFGYAAHTLPLVETVSQQLRTNIIQGRDVNLAALLIPYFRGSGDNNAQDMKPDHRLNKSLTIGEFIQAFGTYKQVMCTAFPHRRVELDLYERDIVDMATRFPGNGFYEYHCQFSMRSAAYLRYNNVCVDWSVRDNNLFSNIFTNRPANFCGHCGSTLHSTNFCPSSPPQKSMTVSTYSSNNALSKNSTKDSTVDSHGRTRVFFANREICNNFNGDRGCSVPVCNKLHACIACKNSDHPKPNCPLGKSGPQTKKK